ncbi:MAG TPA: hypothetical protein VMT34_17740 [Aggregatilineales bacterium]|nr:hypothetical protein [Aggregatilineales bacterium]
MEATHTPRRTDWIALVAILIVAAGLRLGMPGTVEFKRDEANLSHLARDMAQGKTLPLLGIDSSVGIPNAPISVYLIAIPYLFTSDPVIATLFVGALNVMAVGLVYLLAQRYYGTLAAIIAGTFYAVAPWGVIFSRKIWAQDMLPLFVLLTVGTGLLGFIEGKRWAQAIHFPLLAFTGQIHYGAFVLIPVSLFMILSGRKRWTRAFAFSFVITAIVVLPFAIGVAQARLLKVSTLERVVSTGDQPHAITLSGEAVRQTAIIITGTDIHTLAGDETSRDFLDTVPDGYGLFYLAGLLVVLSAIGLAIRITGRRDARTAIDAALLLWFIVPPLIYSVTWTPVFIHYLIPLLPAAFLILGVGISSLWKILPLPTATAADPELDSTAIHPLRRGGDPWALVRARLAIFGGAGLALIAVLQVWMMAGLLTFLDSHAPAGTFGVPLGHLMPVRAALLANHPQAVLASLDGQYIGYNDLTTIWNFLLIDVPSIRFLDHNIDVYPANDTLYFSSDCADKTLAQTFVLPSGEACYGIAWRRAADFEHVVLTPLPDPPVFANGVHVVGTQWTGACLTVATRPDGANPNDYQFAIHLMDAQGNIVSNADAIGWRGRYWQAGDRILRTFCLADPALSGTIAGVQIGMYTYEDRPDGRHFDNIDILDKAGNPAGQYIIVRFGG